MTAVDSLRRSYLLEAPPEDVALPRPPSRASPGSSSGSPTAFGPNTGDFFIGGGFQARTRYNNRSFGEDADGSFVVGMGLGNSQRLIGAEIALTSFSTWRSRPFSVAGMSVKLHRILTPSFGIAVGWENAVMLTDGGDGGSSLYGVASWIVRPGSGSLPQLTASLGVGDGRFRFESDVENNRRTVNAFGSLGIQLLRPVALVADWTGQDLALALSLVPFESVPLIITPGFADTTGSAGDGARFVLGAGIGF